MSLPCYPHPKVLYHHSLAFRTLLALNLALYHLSFGILYQFFKGIASFQGTSGVIYLVGT